MIGLRNPVEMTEPAVFTIDITQYRSIRLKPFCYGPVFNKVSSVQKDTWIRRSEYTVLMLFLTQKL